MFSITDERKRSNVLSMLSALQKQNEEYDYLLHSKSTILKNIIRRTVECLRHGEVKSIKGFVLDTYSRFMINRKVPSIVQSNHDIVYQESEFFCDEKIAVYTAIFGNYESLHEPKIIPDNIDYYIVTDCEIDVNSRWKVIKFELPPKLDAAQKNRYVKMHPKLLFPSYKYSVYVDGSIHILSDLTPLVNRIGEYGFAMHSHSARDDLYDELLAAKYTKRITEEKYNQYKKFLNVHKMPKHYGLVECGVIARNHESAICSQIMEQWWEQYLNGINRDQICLSYVLFQNNIAVNKISTLGSNIYRSNLFKILMHTSGDMSRRK